jgi:hypothetical protein
MLKDSVPCPIPNSEKDAPARPFSRHDITQAGLPFNNDPPAPASFLMLSPVHVAQMTRFKGAREGIVNGYGRVDARKAGNRPENADSDRTMGDVGDSPFGAAQTVIPENGAERSDDPVIRDPFRKTAEMRPLLQDYLPPSSPILASMELYGMGPG